ncbi:unnamed protein product [Mytilus coruscus]|uniref:Uncharacterized protein n=1 Tax=Mytilus coruscus TaxID=42192 RepID=A0A6J8CAX5_MYTCO|nr:unnamed protein product [Mytilus coruscus]
MSPNFEIKLHNQVSTSRVCARVHLTETVHIPANSEIFVEGEIRGPFTGNQDGCLEPLETFKGGSHLLMPKSLVKMTESKVVFSILNPTHESRILKKNIQVASVQPAEQVLAVATSESKIEQNLSVTGNKLPEHLRPLVENSSERLSVKERESLASVINEYTDIFLGPDGQLGHTDLVQHEIDTGNSKPIKLPVNAISKGNNNPSKSSELPDITQSNWVEQWDNEEILRLQQEDSNLSTVMQFLKMEMKNRSNTPNQELSALLRQWDLLFTQNELLYRKFYEIDGSITNQLVAPRELRKEIMQQLHNNRAASHLGREKPYLRFEVGFIGH